MLPGRGRPCRGRHSLQGLIPRVSSEARVALQGRPLCPHVDQSRVAPGRTAEGVSGKGYVPADNVGVLQSRGWSSWWTAVTQAHSAYQAGSPGWCSSRQGGWEGERSGTQFRSCTPHLSTGPQLEPRHVAGSACWEVRVDCGQPRACCKPEVPLHERWAEHSAWPVHGQYGPQMPSTALSEQRGVPTIQRRGDVFSRFGRTLRYGMC